MRNRRHHRLHRRRPGRALRLLDLLRRPDLLPPSRGQARRLSARCPTVPAGVVAGLPAACPRPRPSCSRDGGTYSAPRGNATAASIDGEPLPALAGRAAGADRQPDVDGVGPGVLRAPRRRTRLTRRRAPHRAAAVGSRLRSRAGATPTRAAWRSSAPTARSPASCARSGSTAPSRRSAISRSGLRAAGGRPVLLPMPLRPDRRLAAAVKVHSILAAQFADVPGPGTPTGHPARGGQDHGLLRRRQALRQPAPAGAASVSRRGDDRARTAACRPAAAGRDAALARRAPRGGPWPCERLPRPQGRDLFRPACCRAASPAVLGGRGPADAALSSA